MRRRNIKKILSLVLVSVLFGSFALESLAANSQNENKVTFSVEGEFNNGYASEVLEELNSLRKSLGVNELEMNGELCEVAQQRAAEIAIYFAHERPDTTRYYYFDALKYCTSGENIAAGDITPKGVMNSWKNSEGHYLNMTSSAYTQAGIACFKSTNNVLCWVQIFSNGKSSPVALSGSCTKRIEITALEKYLNLQPSNASYRFSGEDIGKSFTLDVFNENTQFSYVRQKILPSTEVRYSSDNTAVVKPLGDGEFTVRGGGNATVFATISDSLGVSAEVSVKGSGYSRDDLSFALNENGNGYVLTDCNEAVSGAVTIPEIYNGLPVTGIAQSAFYNCKGVTSVSVPNSVTSVGRYAFCNCTSLKSITVPPSVAFIGRLAFGYGEINGIFFKTEEFKIICEENSVAHTYAAVNGFSYTLFSEVLWGDADGDGTVSLKDVILLRRYIANYSYSDNSSDVTANVGADANRDGEINLKDVILVRQYLANYDYSPQ